MAKIVFIIAHPDDEALWIGGLLHSLMNIHDVYLICLSGAGDPDRSKEFQKAMTILDKVKSTHLGRELARQRNGDIPNVIDTVTSGLQKLNLNISDINLLITHSPYGDEHRHRHHIQIYGELSNLAKTNSTPFGFFSYMAIPYYKMISEMSEAKRGFGLHLINFMSCEPYKPTTIEVPKYFVQFRVDDIKHRLLSVYRSINREEHRQGYYAWDSLVEGLYLEDDRALAPIKAMIDMMDTPNNDSKPMQVIRQ